MARRREPAPSPFARAIPPGNDIELVNLASAGKLEEIRARLDAGSSVDSQYVANLRTALFSAVAHKNDDVVRLLLERGANPNLQDFEGLTPLWIAIEDGRQPIVQALLDAGASTELPNRAGVTPFLKAVFSSALRGAKDRAAWRAIVAAVIERTANPYATMPDGRTARSLIAKDLADLLPSETGGCGST